MIVIGAFRKSILSFRALLLAGVVLIQTPAAPQAAPENALGRMFAAALDSLGFVFAGIGSLGGTTELTGAIWRIDIRSGEARRIGSASDLAWPVPSPDGRVVFALRGRQVVKVVVGDGSETSIGTPANWRKLIGIAPDGTVLGFIQDDPRPRPALLEPNGHIAELSPPKDDNERRRNALLLQEMRVYADGVRLEVRDSERGGRGRDIFLIREPKQRNLSDCGDDLCFQPSRSHDGNYVFYIRAPRI